MEKLNIEVKARCPNPEKIEEHLHRLHARYVGEDHQTDTYFKVPGGRLKLREGRIENALIRYNRSENPGLKRSDVILYEVGEAMPALKHILEDTLGTEIIVRKQRKIFFIENVKFHIDRVEKLGDFVEIEAIDRDGSVGEPTLRKQCEYYMDRLGISESDLVTGSYSDLLPGKD